MLAIIVLGHKNAFKGGTIIKKSNSDTGKFVDIKVLPQVPLIEKDRFSQYLNFDLTIRNTSKHILDLSEMEISVIDAKGNLILRKSLNSNGQAPSIKLVGNTIIKPGEIIDIFNPFYNFLSGIPLSYLKYDFRFNYADTQPEWNNNKERLPIDFDTSITIMIRPKFYIDKTTLFLPLKGRVIVWDGHDFYAHHRRFPIGLPKQIAKGITANSNRYAYDFMNIDKNGRMYKGSPFKKENWYAFGKPEYAPGSGRIVEAQNDVPDNEFYGKTIKEPDIPDAMDPLGMGNHIIIDHGNGEYSVLLHMEKGSVRFKAGDKVEAGQQIGNVGFSGDAIYPHVHYTLINGPKELVSEGLPSYFHNYRQYSGMQVKRIAMGRVDSGYIIESEN